MGVSELLEHWQRTKGNLLADKSRAEYLGMFKRFEAWLQDQRIELHDVNHTHLARYRSHCAVQIKPKTWNKHCIALSSLLGEALHLGAIRGPDNPARGLLHNKNALRKTSVARVPFTAEELQRVFAAEPYTALPKPHEYWVPLLCLHQALRANEVCQEARCQFLGHLHESINSSVYTNPDTMARLADVVLPALAFDIDYASLRQPDGHFDEALRSELTRRAALAKQKKRATRRKPRREAARKP
jgi:hypothetical protein